MRRGFELDRALGSAFDLIGRRPLAVLVWGLVSLAPVLAMYAVLLTGENPWTAMAMAANGPDPDAPPDIHALIRFQMWNWLCNILQAVASVLVFTAIYRSVLRPGRQGQAGFSLRFGMDEFRVLVVAIVMVVGAMALTFVVIFLGAGLVAALWPLGEVWRVIGIGAYVLLVLIAMLVLWARLALILPACVLYRDFAFEAGWRLGRGQTGRLTLLLVLACLIALGVSLVLMLVLMLVMAVAIIGVVMLTGVQGWDWHEPTEIMRQLTSPLGLGVIAVGAVLLAICQGIASVIQGAPFASACAQLDANRSDAVTIAGDAPPADDLGSTEITTEGGK